MSNDRRDNPRMPVALDVALYYASVRLPDCQTRDFSLRGVYVHTGGRALPRNAAIDIALALKIGEAVHYHALPAEVARIDGDGVGLMFRHPDPRTLSMLEMLLHAD